MRPNDTVPARDTFAAERLLDRVIASPAKIVVHQGRRAVPLSGVGVHARDIRATPQRYMLDPTVSDWCFSLVTAADAYLAPENPLLRVPAHALWLEWYDNDHPRHRMGHYVRVDATGRSGVLTPYWEDDAGRADMAIIDIAFDLDVPARSGDDGTSRFLFRNNSLPGLDPLLGRCYAVLRPDWHRHLLRRGADAVQDTVRRLIGDTWFHVPQLFAFVALLSNRDAIGGRANSPIEFNSVRHLRESVRHSREPVELLDHVDVRLNLGQRRSEADAATATAAARRAPPRLHYVRGHTATRGGITYWRAPHFRGDAAAGWAGRNVSVVARPGPGTGS